MRESLKNDGVNKIVLSIVLHQFKYTNQRLMAAMRNLGTPESANPAPSYSADATVACFHGSGASRVQLAPKCVPLQVRGARTVHAMCGSGEGRPQLCEQVSMEESYFYETSHFAPDLTCGVTTESEVSESDS